MDKKRKVEYYVREDAVCGETDFDSQNQFETTTGILHEFGHRITHRNGQPFQVTEAIIEDPETHEITYVGYKQLIKFID